MNGKVFFNGVEMPSAEIAMVFEAPDDEPFFGQDPPTVSGSLRVLADEETIRRYFVPSPRKLVIRGHFNKSAVTSLKLGETIQVNGEGPIWKLWRRSPHLGKLYFIEVLS